MLLALLSAAAAALVLGLLALVSLWRSRAHSLKARLVWIVLVVALPIVGAVAWLLLGRERRRRSRRRGAAGGAARPARRSKEAPPGPVLSLSFLPSTTAVTSPAASIPPHSTERVCAAECTRSARLGAIVFRHRGWLPVLFLAVPLVAPGSTSPLRWALGLGLLAVGEWIRLAGVAAAGTVTRRRSRSVQRLVTYGPFAWSRNPLYNGNFLVWLGFGVISGVFWFLPVAVLIFAVEYTLIVRYEEGVLESIFGDEYLEYKRRTPRWFPRPPAAQVAGERHYGEAWRSEVSTFLQYAALIVAFVLKERLR